MEGPHAAASYEEVQAEAEIEIGQAVALQDHALAEFMAMNTPPLRVGASRTCQLGSQGGPALQCVHPGCTLAGCQGNRVEIHAQRFYSANAADLYKQPLPSELEFFEPEPEQATHAECLLAARLLAGGTDEEGSEGGGGGSSRSHGSSGYATPGLASGDDEMACAATSTDGTEHVGAEADAPGAQSDDGGGGCSAAEAAMREDRVGSHAGATTSSAAEGAAGDADGAAPAGRKVPLMRCILVHFKTARTKKAINFILPFIVARSVHRWITYGRPALMAELGGPGAHRALFVSPSSGRPMEIESFTRNWHALQQRCDAPWTTFPPSALRHMYVGERVLNLGELLQVAAVQVGADTVFMANSTRMWEVSG